MDYERLRRDMVNNQLVARGISDRRVLDAMLRVPRHLFVREQDLYRAYDDMALPIGEGQTISQPYMVAKMTELLELKGDEKVLEVGTGSGYQAAVLSELAKEVFTIERVSSLAVRAEEILKSLGYRNVQVIVGDGTLGLLEQAPFDRIIVTASAPDVPEPLKEQLAEGGILVMPVGSRFSQELVKLKRTKGTFQTEYSTLCVFVPLIGKYGWEE
ncbi:MAG: protein-L-isoaspartate(D-aspartate) O-methyltransferase [Nitrospirae bacterium]|nr:MAG: protein-L-isoaspartate(D-aspartate) O-methyltransferase [Nitrospirota bacterium]